MTNTEDPLKALTDQIEPAVVAFAAAYPRENRATYSQAVSLKRIADALETLAARYAMTDMPLSVFENRERAASVDDPWQAWPGGECPVPEGTLVDVRFRDGYTEESRPAEYWAWTNGGKHLRDIVAWRLAK